MLLEIAQYGNPVLKEKCRPVEHFDDSLKTLAENMLETMYAAEGIGLAAPQVSIPIQLVVIDIPKEEESVTWLKVNGEDKELSDIMPLMKSMLFATLPSASRFVHMVSMVFSTLHITSSGKSAHITSMFLSLIHISEPTRP